MTDERSENQEENFESLLNESFKKGHRLSPGEKVEAKVVVIGSESVFLDVGSRSDGVLPRPEVEKEGELQVEVGDTITVYFKGLRDGSMMFTKRFGSGGAEDRKGGNEAVLNMLRDAFEGNVPVDGTVKESVKGGFSVMLMGQRAFCPISQIDKVYCEDPTVHLNQTYGFILTEFGEEGRNIIISRRRLLEREAEEAAAALWETITEGAVYEGTITALQKYGAFVDIGGIEGLVHVSEISHTRVADPKDLLSVGQKVEVTVISMDAATRKISLSIKSLAEDPWVEAVQRFAAGQVVRGKITRLAQFGAFVELSPGVEGLIHISKLGTGQRVQNVRDVVKPGQEVAVEVVEVDSARRRISLAMHDQEADDERSVVESYNAMQWVEGRKPLGTLGDLLAKKIKK